MKKTVLNSLLFLTMGYVMNAQTIPTQTITGNLKVTESITVKSISASNIITALGEISAKDTLRAQKDIVVNGSARIGGSLILNGIGTASTMADPCGIKMLAINPTTRNLVEITSAQATELENTLSLTPCPTAPVMPFTWQTFGNHVNNNNRWIGTIENYDFNVKTNNTLRLVIKNNGQMFFGTQKINSTHLHANSQFQFDGKIGCKELVVVDPTKWADFVFADNYKLPSLNDVESYYLTNKHLLSVPSELEVKENGINTAEMDAILLQKIEELTLYIVQQQKEIEALKKEIRK